MCEVVPVFPSSKSNIVRERYLKGEHILKINYIY